MTYKRKYKKGEIIKSLNEMMAQEFIYCGDKILHKGWFGSWQIRMAQTFIDRGFIFKAIKKETKAGVADENSSV